MSSLELKRHPYHIVDPSPWPFFTALGVLATTMGLVLYMHSYKGGGVVLSIGLTTILFILYTWSRDIVREGTYQGHHTIAVQRGLRLGMLVFISTEAMFFAAFFWGFFHSSLAPNVEIGSVWPPKGIHPLNAWDVPFVNTLILLLSGVTVTWSHHAMIHGDRIQAITGLCLTVLLAIGFTGLQGLEYFEAPFAISDGIYGSTFFMCTGFHGFHVIVGTIFLFICLIREVKYHFTTTHHVGFEAAAWYWHFVDVIWLFLFVSIYWWGGN